MDLYSPTNLYQQTVWGVRNLEDATHTVTIEWTGTKNASSTNTFVGVDAVAVVGTLCDPPAPQIVVTRLEETSTHIEYSGTWLDASSGAASGGTYKSSNSVGTSATIAFAGSSINWIGQKAPNYGRALLVLDNGATQTVDCYDPATIRNTTLWSSGTLSDGPHTLRIVVSGSRNASATGTYVSLDAFDLVLHAGVMRYEQTEPYISYAGTWLDASSGAASGGTYKTANAAGASAIVRFAGTRIDWIGQKSPSYGKAWIVLDKGATQTVDCYDPNTLRNKTLWSASGLVDTTHTVTILYSGSKNASATGTYISMDALDIDNVMLPPLSTASAPMPTRFEQTSSSLAWNGPWSDVSTGAASGGSYKSSDGATGSVAVWFNGTSFEWLGTTGPGFGKARLTIDSSAPVDVDLYSSVTTCQARIWSLQGIPSGLHKVRIDWTGTRNASATASAISVDAFDILGALQPATLATRFEQTDTRMRFTGPWVTYATGSLSGGSYAFVNTTATVSVSFTGTTFAWITSKDKSYGIASLSLDGGTPLDVDLYSPTNAYQQTAWSAVGLTNGPHTVTLSWTGRANTASTNKYVGIDAVEVLGALDQAQ